MPNFPRQRLFTTAAQRLRAYNNGPDSKPILVNQHEVSKENQTNRFRYIVRVTTFNQDEGVPKNRYLTLITDERVAKGELLAKAQDIVMTSPVASQEEFSSAGITFALRRK